MVWAGSPHLRQARSILAVHKSQDRRILLHGSDHPLLGGNLPAQPRQNRKPKGFPLFFSWGFVLSPTEGLFAAIFLFHRLGRSPNQLQRQLVAFLVVLMPVDQAMLTHDRPFGFGVILAQFFQNQSQVETRPLPFGPDHFVPINLFRQLFTLGTGGERDRRVRMGMIHVPSRHKPVQRSVDGRRTGIQIEGAVGVGSHHIVLDLGLRPLGLGTQIIFLQPLQLLHVEGGKTVSFRGPQIPTRSFDPQNLGILMRQGILFRDFRGSVSPTCVRQGWIFSDEVRAVDESGDRIEGLCHGILPAVFWMVFHIFYFLFGVRRIWKRFHASSHKGLDRG